MIESPTNPIQRICDIKALAGKARMVIDNIFWGIDDDDDDSNDDDDDGTNETAL